MPTANDYDAWQDAFMQLITQYVDCATKHHKTVEAWPK